MRIRLNPASSGGAPARQSSRYQAFISYSHAADGRLAPALQNALQGFACPWYRSRAIRVFRDQTSLSATPALWTSIVSALDDSEFFILLASPDAARSEWVGREVAHWRQNRSPEQMLLVVTEGQVGWDDAASDFAWDQTDAVPRALAGAFSSEPLYVDMRWATDDMHLSRKNPRFMDVVADLAAPLHHKPKDDMVGDGIRQQRRNARWAWSAATVLAILTIVAIVGALVAVQQRNEARTQRAQALSRQLAAQAVANTNARPDLALLLALEARHQTETADAENALFGALQQTAIPGRHFVRDGSIDTIAYSPGGTSIAAASRSDGAITIFELADETPRELTSSLSGVSALAFSPSGDLFAAASYDGDLDVWSASDWSRVIELPRDDSLTRAPAGSGIADITFSPDGRMLATALTTGTVALWDVASWTISNKFTTLHDRSAAAIAFGPDGTKLAVASEPGGIWNVATRQWDGAPIPSLYGDAAFAADGRRVAALDSGGAVNLVDVEDPTHFDIPVTAPDPNIDAAIAFSPDGSLLATVGNDGFTDLWDPARVAKVGQPLPRQGSGARAMAFSPDGRALAVAEYDGNLTLWDLNVPPVISHPLPLQHNEFPRLALSPDGQWIAVSGYQSGLQIWNLGQDPPRPTTLDDSPAAALVAFSSDGMRLASFTDDGQITIWDVQTWTKVSRFPAGTSAYLQAVSFLPGKDVLAAAYGDGKLLFWDLDANPPRASEFGATINGHGDVAFSPDAALVAALAETADGSEVQIWKSAAATTTATTVGRSPVQALGLAFTPDGSAVAVGYYDGTVVTWDIASGERRGKVLVTGPEAVDRIAIDPTGNSIAVGTSQPSAAGGGIGTLTLWDLRSGSRIGKLVSGVADISDIWFSADGRTLAAAHGGATSWDVRPEHWEDRACSLLRRNLTGEEWDFYLAGQASRRTCPNLPGPG